MTTCDLSKLPPDLVLTSGGHSSPSDGLCLLEAVAYVAGEAHSDRPDCVSPMFALIGRRLNDASWSSAEARTKALSPLIPLLVGTVANSVVENRRAAAFGTWVVRTFTRRVLERASFWTLAEEAEKKLFAARNSAEEYAVIAMVRKTIGETQLHPVSGPHSMAQSFFYMLAIAHVERVAGTVNRAWETVNDSAEPGDDSVLLLVAEKLKTMCLEKDLQ